MYVRAGYVDLGRAYPIVSFTRPTNELLISRRFKIIRGVIKNLCMGLLLSISAFLWSLSIGYFMEDGISNSCFLFLVFVSF